MTTPQNEESNLIKSLGEVPLLNRPASGTARDYPLTGYRDQTDDNGRNNKEAAVEYLANLESIPKDAEGKFNVFLLNDVPHEPGTAAPLEMFRRGLLEMGAHSFLYNAYPEWIGDATDDANADLEALQYLHSLKEYGYEQLNEHLNAKPQPDPDHPDDDEEDWDYPEENILSMSFSSVVQELFTLMLGRSESKRLAEEQTAESHRQYMKRHDAAIEWAKETHDLDLQHEPSPSQGIYAHSYSTPDRLTTYFIWDNPFRIVLKKVRPNIDVPFEDESVEVTHYMPNRIEPGLPSYYPNLPPA